MAIWQCDIQLIPDTVVNNSPLDVKIRFDDDLLDTTYWWSNHQPDKSWHQLLTQEFPIFQSWSDEILMWGDEEGILFQVGITGDVVEEIGVRIDVRHLDEEKIKKMIQVIKQIECHIFFMETQVIIPPVHEEFISNLKESRAMAFIEDPRRCLEKMGEHRKTDQKDFIRTSTQDNTLRNITAGMLVFSLCGLFICHIIEKSLGIENSNDRPFPLFITILFFSIIWLVGLLVLAPLYFGHNGRKNNVPEKITLGDVAGLPLGTFNPNAQLPKWISIPVKIILWSVVSIFILFVSLVLLGLAVSYFLGPEA